MEWSTYCTRILKPKLSVVHYFRWKQSRTKSKYKPRRAPPHEIVQQLPLLHPVHMGVQPFNQLKITQTSRTYNFAICFSNFSPSIAVPWQTAAQYFSPACHQNAAMMRQQSTKVGKAQMGCSNFQCVLMILMCLVCFSYWRNHKIDDFVCFPYLPQTIRVRWQREFVIGSRPPCCWQLWRCCSTGTVALWSGFGMS